MKRPEDTLTPPAVKPQPGICEAADALMNDPADTYPTGRPYTDLVKEGPRKNPPGIGG